MQSQVIIMKKYDILKHYGIVLRNASQNFIKCNEVNAKEMQTTLHLPDDM